MKLSLEDKTKLEELGQRASNLLIEILDEPLLLCKVPTKCDKELKKVLSKIHQIYPLLSDSYILMYNHIQKQKISPGDDYYKQFKKNDD